MLPVPVRRDRSELLDTPESVLPYLDANLRDIRRLNKWFGATALILRLAKPFLHDSCAVLDVATGSADIPVAVHDLAAATGLRVTVTALDSSEDVLSCARSVVGNRDIRLVCGDALSLPFPNGSFDLVMCNLALHHFGPEQAMQVLREMWRVSRHGLVVQDVERSYPGLAGAWLASRTVAATRLTRHDAPLSVLRAYTVDELACLARGAALPAPKVRRHPFFRLSLVAPVPDLSHG